MAKGTEIATAETVPVTGEQLLDLVKTLVQQNQLTQDALANSIPSAIGSALHEANARARQWWKEEEYPGISAFNPQGEKDHPRPTLTRDILWLGYHLQEEQQTREEIDLLNQLRPGDFDMHDALGQVVKRGYFKVRSLDAESPTGRLLVMYPCATTDERMELQKYDRGRGMVDLLLELVPGARGQAVGGV